MAKVCIKGIPWTYDTGSIAEFVNEGDYLHLPNGRYFKVVSITSPFEVVEVKREEIPEGTKVKFLLEEGAVGFDRNGPIVRR